MNKKILCLCMGAVGIIVLATFTSVVGLQTINAEKKESPLFAIRSGTTIGEETKNIKEKIIARFIQNRLFLLMPSINEQNPTTRNLLEIKTGFTCVIYASCRMAPFCTIHGCILNEHDVEIEE